jgi:hypothetical protein
MVRFLVVAVSSIAIALAGCQVSTAPQTVATIGDHNAPSMARAPWTGSFTLYKILSEGKKPQKTAVQSVHLKKDEPLGFRVRETGPVAVAGDLEIPAPDGKYQWVMQPDPGQTDPLATTILVVVITAIVVGVIILLLYLAGEAAASAAASAI